MKALTLHQPWASLVAFGVKSIETRSWSTSYRGPLAIHAGLAQPKQMDLGVWTVGRLDPGAPRRLWSTAEHGRPFDLPLGAVVATCELVDVVPTDALDWFKDKWGPTSEPFGWKQLQVIRPPEPADTFVCESERPYGDFSEGRFAWLLGDVEEVDVPVLARGRQGLWEWSS